MGYYDRDNPDPPVAAEPEPGALIRLGMDLTVRLLGVAVLVVGLWVAVTVVMEAWGLYTEPARIERLAAAVERGSNIDRALSPRRPAPPPAAAPGAPEAPPGAAPDAPDVPAASGDEVRLSYFLAWIVAIALLFLVAFISLWMVKTGGELALHDTGRRRRAGRKPE